MTSPAVATPLPPNLRHAFGGVWRLTFPGFFRPGQLLRLAGLLVVLGLVSLASVRTAEATVFFGWTIRYLTLVLPAIAFIGGGGAVRDDLRSDTVDYVFTRPLPRPTYLFFKFIAHVVGMQVCCLLALGVLCGVGGYREVPGLFAALPLLALAQVLAVTVFTALGFLCATLTARYLVVGMTYGSIVELGIGSIPTQLGRLSLTHQLQAMLQPIDPGAAATLTAQGPVTTALVLLLVTVAVLAPAAFVFGLRELSGGPSKES